MDRAVKVFKILKCLHYSKGCTLLLFKVAAKIDVCDDLCFSLNGV